MIDPEPMEIQACGESPVRRETKSREEDLALVFHDTAPPTLRYASDSAPVEFANFAGATRGGGGQPRRHLEPTVPEGRMTDTTPPRPNDPTAEDRTAEAAQPSESPDPLETGTTEADVSDGSEQKQPRTAG